MNLSKSKAKAICDVCIEHLIDEGKKQDINITRQLIKTYMDGNGNYVSSLNDVYRCLIGTLQNANRLPNVIKFYKGLDTHCFLGFDHMKMLDTYGKSIRKLRLAVKELNPDVAVNGVLWERFLTGVLDAAKWLSQFNNFKSFKNYLNAFHQKGPIGINILISVLSDGRIKGLGPALAFNFIKDLGLGISKDVAKPDTHTIKTMVALGLCKSSNNEEDVVEAIAFVASKVGISTFAMDKILWLANSGNFHDDNFGRLWGTSQTGKHRAIVVNAIKAKWRYLQ
jgi:hypothetical protein